MSSSANLDSLLFATRQINLYGGLFVFITGIFGELLNIVVFTTLNTFRQTTCSFYLIAASVANIDILITILLRVIYDGSNSGFIYTSLLCKFRFFLIQYAGLVSLTSMCLATIDQFISMTTYKHWSSLKIARRSIAFACIFWFITGIPTFIYYDSYLNVCIIINAAYIKYFTYFHTLLLFGCIPLTILIVFSVLAFLKIRSIASRQINIVRLSRDRQLTAMTLFHVLFIIILGIPFVIGFIHNLGINTKDPVEVAHNQLVYTIIILFYYMSYSCSFYIYCCVSKRFRKQVAYVLIQVHLNRCRRRVNNNQIIPYPMELVNKHRQTALPSSEDIALY